MNEAAAAASAAIAAVRIARRGLMLVLSSPSGAGKTTISRRLLARHRDLSMSVSMTTRPPRPGEVDGKDYIFVNPEAFERMVREGAFLEHATVFDNRYGTPRDAVDSALAAGRDVLFDVDWQGTQQLRHNARADLVGVFILPPSHAELERRLTTRAQDTAEVVARRMARATDEMSHWPEYDYVVINDEVETTVARVEAILAAERQRRDRLTGLPAFVATLSRG